MAGYPPLAVDRLSPPRYSIGFRVAIGEATAIGMEDPHLALVIPIGIVVLLGVLQWALTFLNVRWTALERLTQGTQTAVVKDGEVQQAAMRAERMSQADLLMELRQKGIASVQQVREAYLEPTGQVSVFQTSSSSSSGGSRSEGSS